MRSPFFWIVAAFLVFLLFSQIAAVVDGPDNSGMVADPDQSWFNAVAAILLLGGIIVGFWRGTTNTPGASLADVVILMRSPISSRFQFALLAARPSLLNAVIISLWSLAASSGLLFGIPDGWIALRIVFLIAVVILLSELLRNAVWVGTEQVAAGSPRRGSRLRFFVKMTTAMVGGIIAATLLWPLAQDTNGDWREALDLLVERGDSLAAIPPLSLAASVMNPEGASIPSAIGLLLLLTATAALGLYWARDFVEPISITAERKTDARGQMLEAGSDVQWAALSQFGVSPHVRVSVPAFGRGAWALLWGSTTRWVRYQIAAAWITFVILGGFGLITAIGVHLGFVSVYLAWGVALFFPFFGSVNMFMDELRRQFIFLVPGSSRSRLTAAALTSVLDGMISSLIVILVLAAVGVIPPSHAIGLAALGMSIALLGQACLALVQILLPFWAGQRTRVTITFGLTGLAFLPSMILLVGLYVAAGAVAGLLAAAGSTLATGFILLIIAGYFFDRIEYSG